MVKINGLAEQEIILTKVGRRVMPDSEPLSLSELIGWYAEFSSGDPGFRRVDTKSTLASETDKYTKWARQVWEKSSYGISYHVVTHEEAKRLVDSRKCVEDDDLPED